MPWASQRCAFLLWTSHSEKTYLQLHKYYCDYTNPLYWGFNNQHIYALSNHSNKWYIHHSIILTMYWYRTETCMKNRGCANQPSIERQCYYRIRSLTNDMQCPCIQGDHRHSISRVIHNIIWQKYPCSENLC